MSLSLVEEKRAREIWAEAKRFVEGARIFNDYKSAATSAVAEYVANQEGKTLFESRIKLPLSSGT